MLKEDKASWIRIPLYLWISATSVALAIAVMYAARIWFFNNSFAVPPPDNPNPLDLLLALVVFFFGFLFFIAPACVSCIALLTAYFLMAFGDLKIGDLKMDTVFLLFTVLLVLVGLWLLAPHMDFFIDMPQSLRIPVAYFRWVYLCANGLVGLIMIAINMKDAIQLEWSIHKRMSKH